MMLKFILRDNYSIWDHIIMIIIMMVLGFMIMGLMVIVMMVIMLCRGDIMGFVIM